MPVSALPADALFHACAPEKFTFTTSDELEPLKDLLGQERALEAIRFGTAMDHAGYNLFVLGDEGAGHGEAVAELLRQCAAKEPAPADWVYVTNFEAASKPLALKLARGGGRRRGNGVRRHRPGSGPLPEAPERDPRY